MNKQWAKRAGTVAAACMFAASTTGLLASCEERTVVLNDPISLPLEEKVTLDWWTAYDSTYTPEYSTLGDHPFFQWMEEKTNIHINFVHPAASALDLPATRTEYINKVAAGTLVEDMVSHHWFTPELSGPTMDYAVGDGLYVDLTEYINVQMPNFQQLRSKYAVIEKGLYTPEGRILYIPGLTGVADNDKAPASSGLIIRKDMLDELQLDVPVTVDDWDNVLHKLKAAGGVETPLNVTSMSLTPTLPNWTFLTAWGIGYEFYINQEGKLAYGAIEQSTYEYVEMMARWYSEGLLDRKEITQEAKLSNNVAAWSGTVDDIANMKNLGPQDPDYEIVAAPDPVHTLGDKIDTRGYYLPVGNQEINSIYVTQKAENPALVCKWIDQLFTDEAYNRASYGVEGEDYTRNADGTIQFTDKILNDPSGARFGVAKACYLGSMWSDRDVLLNYVYGQEVQDAVALWSQATCERNMIRPTSLPMTAEEQEAVAGLGNFFIISLGNVRGFLIGDIPLSEWDDYVTQMKDAGIDQYVEIYQTAWDRYNAG